MGCATCIISKRLNITLSFSTIAEDKYNVVEKEDGYVGSNPTIFTNLLVLWYLSSVGRALD